MALAAALGVSGTLVGRRVEQLAVLLRAAKPAQRSGAAPTRARKEVTDVLGQRKLLQRLGPGLMHAAIFWGFLVLIPTVLIAMIAIVDRHQTLPWLGAQGWYALLVDVFCVLVLVAVTAAFWNRKVIRPKRFQGSHSREADLVLIMIAVVVVSLLLWHASRIALGYNEWPRDFSPVANLLSHIFSNGPATRVLERVFVWTHVLTILVFIAYLPYTKHLHVGTAAINVWFARTGARGRLEPLRFEPEEGEREEDLRFGAGTAADLTWKQVLDTYTCTECGRCQDACPANQTGKVLSPKLVIMGLRDQLLHGERDAPLVPNAVSEEAVWDCVTCGACVQACPVSIEHIDHIIDLRRHLVMVESSFPAEADPMLRDIERSSNPWGNPQAERADWTEGLDVRVLEPGEAPPEYLYWVGCAASYDERAKRTAQAVARLLKIAKVDFAILGPRECCTGDPARRMGNEYVYQSLAEENIATMNGAGVSKIVASCPHCYNTLANEYPDFGGNYEVIHHSELLAELVRDGRLKPKADANLKVTYHDSCYLARHNDVLEAPRELVASVGQPLEMARHGRETFCCGAGGAHMWLEERANQINENRVREAAETGADTLAVACPFCTVMLDDGAQTTGTDIRVADVATLLAEALDR
ncbi:MAG: (Fe-S)-binding protein [Solirubrobacteraceae bacterium]